MNVEELRTFCLSLTGARERMPFTKPEYSNLVAYTLADKWFVLVDLDDKRINVKCDPELSVEIQQRYSGAYPAWHMNKRLWLGIDLDSDIPDDVVRELITDSYRLILDKLPLKIRSNYL